MATTYTTNYNLGKQENHADKFDMDVLTDNADKIDAALTGLQSGIDGKQDALSSEQLAAVNSGITEEDVTQIGVNKNNISSIQTEIGAPTITSSTTLADYANALARGYHTGFFTSGSKPSDAPVSDNCFVDFFVYSANTATMRVYPSGTAYNDAIYYRTKVSGTWQGWFKFQGTAVT